MKEASPRLFASLAKKLMIFLLVLAFLLLVGHLLANHFNDAHYVVRVPEKNNPLFILWRGLIYSIVILLLTPAIVIGLGHFIHLPQRINHKKLRHCRKITMISMVIYECVIVQNLFKAIVQWGYYYVSG